MGVDAEHGRLVTMKIAADDYHLMKQFFAAISQHIPAHRDLPAELDPMVHLERMEATSKSKARAGLGMAIGDLMEELAHLPLEQVRAIDASLVAAGSISLTTVRARFSGAVRAIMARGSVRSEREYYALRNAVEGMADEQQGEAWRLLGDFEARIAAKRSKAEG